MVNDLIHVPSSEDAANSRGEDWHSSHHHYEYDRAKLELPVAAAQRLALC
jgi:hypothetical protein